MHCLRALQRAGHQVVACLPETESFAASARELDVPTHDPYASLDVIREIRCDWIISAANIRIIPPEILRLPVHGTLNFHDGPLPRYAGLNVLTRALIEGEDEHGVTWHLVEEGIDTGDIVVQKSVPIRDDDTSQSLSLRCLEAGIEGFDEIVDLLSKPDCLPRRQQNLHERTYFGSSHWPREGMEINWQWPAARIARLVRALDVGPFPNRIGFARFRVDGSWHRILQAEVCPKDGTAAGAIERGEDGPIRIGTTDGCLIATSIHPPLPPSATVADVLAESQLDQIARWEETIYAQEARWRTALQFSNPDDDYETSRTHSAKDVDIPIGSKDSQLACFVLASALIHGSHQLRVGRWWKHDELAKSAPEDSMLQELLHPVASVQATCRDEVSLQEAFDTWSRAVSRCQKRGPFFSDLLERGGKGESPMQDPASLALQWWPEGCPNASDDGTVTILKAGDQWISRSRHDLSHLHDLATTLQAILQDAPETPWSELPRIGAKTAAMLEAWEDGGSFESPPRNFLKTIFHNFIEHADAVAIETADGVCWDYRRLGLQTAGWMRSLQAQNLKHGSLIPVRLGRSPEAIAAKLAIMACGHAYIPVSKEDPPARVKDIIEQTQASVAIGEAPDGDTGITWLKSEGTVPADTPLEVDDAADVLCVFFTSGSTGKPKGVPIPRKGLEAYLEFSLQHYGASSFERSLWSSSVAFDSSLSEVFTPLIMGGCLIIPNPESVWSVRGLVQTIRDHHITYGGIATALWSLWMRDSDHLEDPIPACLRLVSIGGGTMEPELVEKWLRMAPEGTRLFNDFGPTEITVVCSHHEVSASSLDPPSIPIGRPNTGDKILVLDDKGKRVAPGVIGELVLGGLGVAGGYLNQEQLTAERFVSIAGEKGIWYRSGDRGSWTSDGELLFHGRVDDQVKIHGYRVEPAETQRAIRQLEAVTDAEVITIGSGTAKELAAAVMVDGEGSDRPHQLQKQLEEVLPRHAVPRRWLLVDEWPRTSNGKIDRQKLARLLTDSSQAKTTQQGINPLDPDSILSAIRDVLHRPDAVVGDSFFGQGGDSIAAINLQVQLEQVVGKSLPLTLVYASNSLQDIIDGVMHHASNDEEHDDVHWQVIKKTPNAPDLVFMPSMEGYAFPRHLWPGAGQFASIHAIELDPLEYGTLTKDLEDRDVLGYLARHYASLIRKHLPDGRPILVGYSVGGWFAIETARALEQEGYEVGRLILIEPGVRHVGKGLFHVRYVMDSLTNHLIHGLNRRRVKNAETPESEAMRQAIPELIMDRSIRVNVSSVFRRALTAYHPTPTETAITLVNRTYHTYRYHALKRIARGPFKRTEVPIYCHMDFVTKRSEQLLLDIIADEVHAWHQTDRN